jgi:hypothetical protein
VSPKLEPERDITRARLHAQLLGGSPASGTEQVLQRLLAVQAQDQRGARLAIRARSTLTSATDVDDALTHRRSALVTWLNRGTLHLVTTEDYCVRRTSGRLTSTEASTSSPRRSPRSGPRHAPSSSGCSTPPVSALRDRP